MAEKSMSDLPEGMLTEIFVRLPVKSLLICKSVCKPWLSIISTPHFIKSQLRRAIIASMNTPTLLTIQNPPPTESELAFEQTMKEMESKFVVYTSTAYDLKQQRRRQLVNQAVVDANGQDLSSSPVQFDRLVIPRLYARYGVGDCCNGIICLASCSGNHVYLWNPSIRMGKELPAPKPYTTRRLPVKMGFGYDSVSGGYKFFRIVCEKMFDKVPIVQIYSTITDSWREFRDPILTNDELYMDRTNIDVNGVLYFDGEDALISFDLHTEVFGRVPFPSLPHRKGSDLLDFQGSVAMVFQTGPEIFDLWTLHDDSDQVFWTKRFGIEADSETEIWLTKYLGAGQFYGKKLLLNESINLYNVLYDNQKKETKFYGLLEEGICGLLKYTETLVSLDGFVHVE